MNTVIAILQQNLMQGCAPPLLCLASISTVPQNCSLQNGRLKMEDGKNKPGNLLERGFISFFAERHMLFTERNVVL